MKIPTQDDFRALAENDRLARTAMRVPGGERAKLREMQVDSLRNRVTCAIDQAYEEGDKELLACIVNILISGREHARACLMGMSPQEGGGA